jgi:peptidoglycan/LPS O-acetylase OafA/YrhL
VELLKGSFGLKHYWNEPMIFNLGGLGVYFFFVLSGFLITYLLLKEKEKAGKINIRDFYLRRILRIWPLYYFILILGFFILPYFEEIHISYLEESFVQNFHPNLILFIIILPNLALALYGAVPHIGHLWSIGVEEQFYIFWPWLVSKAKNIARALVLIIVIIVLVKVLILALGMFYGNKPWFVALKLFIAMSKFECMAIGGLGAYYLFKQNARILKFIFNRFVLCGCVVLIPLLVYFTPARLQDGIHIVFSFIFLVIIINVAANPATWFKLENRFLSYLGKISYGIYMYHFMITAIVLAMLKHLAINTNEILFNCLIYSTVLLSTILVSGLSYEFLEKRFIKLKGRYTVIKSGSQESEN